MAQQLDATWADASTQYQSSIGAISLQSAAQLVIVVAQRFPLSQDSHVLDVGCGPGAITLAILAHQPATPIEAIDTSQKMLDDLDINLARLGSNQTVNTKVVDLHDITTTYGSSSFTHVFASYILHVAARSFSQSALDFHHILEPGGAIAIATFTPQSDPYIIWSRVCRHFDSEYIQPNFAPDPDAWTDLGKVVRGLQDTGFVDVSAKKNRAAFPIRGVDAWTAFFFDGKNPVSEALMRPFFESHSVGKDEVRAVFRTVVQNEWNRGTNIQMEYILAIGRKGL